MLRTRASALALSMLAFAPCAALAQGSAPTAMPPASASDTPVATETTAATAATAATGTPVANETPVTTGTPEAPVAPAAPAPEPPYTLAGAQLVVSLPGTSRQVPLGCQGRTLLRHRTQLHVACDDGRVLTFDLTDPSSPTLVRREHAGGTVQGFSVVQDRVWVQIVRTETHPLGMEAAPARPVAATAIVPPKARGEWVLEITARPFAPLRTPGLGLLFDATVGYRFLVPIYLEVGITPAGFILARNSSPFGTTTEAVTGLVASRVAVHYDASILSIGVGVGGSTIQLPGGTTPAMLTGGVMFTQSLRIGTRDGLHLAGESAVAIVQGRFDFIGLRAHAQIPLRTTLWMVLRAGGGSAGYAFGEVGVRLPVHGHGERGSVFLTPTIGGAAIVHASSLIGGPMLGLQLEARL